MEKRIVILGGGESGAGSAVLAKAKGYDVFLSDFGEIKLKYKELLNKYEIQWEEKQHTEELILNAAEIIKSPGIADKVSIVKKAIEKQIPIISEIEFASRYTNAKTICITGANGKTTTTLLIYHMLKKAGLNVGLAGNVGKSFALQVAENNFDFYVLELSSFQLDGMFNFKANIAILTNITPDHLDRYDYNFQNYIDSKFRVIQNQTDEDYFIFFEDDEIIKKEISKRNIKAMKLPFSLSDTEQEGAYVKDNQLVIKYTNNYFTMTIHDLALQGRHNTCNSMAAALTGCVAKLRKDVIRESLSDFENIEHRLEPITRVHGVEYINDSKATNVNSTWYAIESIKDPIIWIAGGVDKGNDYSMLTDLVKDKVKIIICIGVNNTKIHAAFEGLVDEIIDASSMDEAVRISYMKAKKGENVLLSPACASFDRFENYEERGWIFKKAVRAL